MPTPTRCGVGVELITQDTGAWLGEPVRAGNSVSFTLVPCWTWPSRRVALSPGFSAAVQQRVATNRTAIVHDHGVWMQANFAAAQAASRLNLPLIVTPHGLLRARAVEHKRWKLRGACTRGESSTGRAYCMPLRRKRRLICAGWVCGTH